MKCLAEIIQRLESLSGALPASAKSELNYVLGMLAAMLYDKQEDEKEDAGMYGGD